MPVVIKRLRRKKLKEFKIDLETIPAGMTGIVQPADIGWFKLLKANYHRRWTDWDPTNNKTFTASNS